MSCSGVLYHPFQRIHPSRPSSCRVMRFVWLKKPCNRFSFQHLHGHNACGEARRFCKERFWGGKPSRILDFFLGGLPRSCDFEKNTSMYIYIYIFSIYIYKMLSIYIYIFCFWWGNFKKVVDVLAEHWWEGKLFCFFSWPQFCTKFECMRWKPSCLYALNHQQVQDSIHQQ